MSERFTAWITQDGVIEFESPDAFQQWKNGNKCKKIMVTVHSFWYDLSRPQMNTIKGWAREIAKHSEQDLEYILNYAKENIGLDGLSDADLTSKEANALMHELDRIALWHQPPIRLPYPQGWNRRDVYGEENV